MRVELKRYWDKIGLKHFWLSFSQINFILTSAECLDECEICVNWIVKLQEQVKFLPLPHFGFNKFQKNELNLMQLQICFLSVDTSSLSTRYQTHVRAYIHASKYFSLHCCHVLYRNKECTVFQRVNKSRHFNLFMEILCGSHNMINYKQVMSYPISTVSD